MTVKARQGSVVWPYPPAPVTLATNHCAQEIAEAVIKALARSCPDRVLAGWSRRFRIAISGVNPADAAAVHLAPLPRARGRRRVRRPATAGRPPARARRRVASSSGAWRWRRRASPSSSSATSSGPAPRGDGRHRGGVGSLLTLRVETDRGGPRQHRGRRGAPSLVRHPRRQGRPPPPLPDDRAGADARPQDQGGGRARPARRHLPGGVRGRRGLRRSAAARLRPRAPATARTASCPGTRPRQRTAPRSAAHRTTRRGR